MVDAWLRNGSMVMLVQQSVYQFVAHKVPMTTGRQNARYFTCVTVRIALIFLQKVTIPR